MTSQTRGRGWRFRLGTARVMWPGAAVALLVLAVLIGGGGSRYALSNLLIQIAAIAAISFYYRAAWSKWTEWPRGLKILAAATIALPLLHLIPLPSGMWQTLPGRGLAAEARDIVAMGDGWFPLTLDRSRTVLAFAALLPPLAVLLLMPKATTGQSLIRLILALAVANLVLGGFQIVINANLPYGYPVLERGRLYGFFANHNTSGLFFVIALCLLTGANLRFGQSKASSAQVELALKAGLAIALVVGVILTQSRSSNALMALVLAGWLVTAVRRRWADGGAIKRWYLLVPAALVALVIALVWGNNRVRQTIDRFGDLDDQRYSIWSDTLVAIDHFFPVGSGMGSFDEVFQNFESLETLVPAMARRAHNDYLEIGLEAGLFGLALVAGWLLWLGVTWWRRRRGPAAQQNNAVVLALTSIAAQSCVDYPLRNEAILCVAAALIGILVMQPIGTSKKR